MVSVHSHLFCRHVWGEAVPPPQKPPIHPQHTHTSVGPLQAQTYGFMGGWAPESERHSHPHWDGWVAPTSPIHTAAHTPSVHAAFPVGSGFESRPMLTPILHTAPRAPSPEAPTLQLSGPLPSLFPPHAHPCPSRKVLEAPRQPRSKELTPKRRGNPPYFGRKTSCQEVGSHHQRDPGF